MDRDPRVLFGAFDRHNQGDPLFPRIVTALRPDEEFVFAGIARCDPRGGELAGCGQSRFSNEDYPERRLALAARLGENSHLGARAADVLGRYALEIP